jgi:hypothetical protein
LEGRLMLSRSALYSAGARSLVIRELEPPVTVIAALRENDGSVLIAADSGEMERFGLGPTSSGRKLHKHERGPLAWGVTGNPEICAREFNEWLTHKPWPPRDWLSFVREVRRELGRANKEEKDAIRAAGDEPGDEDTADVLLVAWMDGPRIYEFNAHGNAYPYETAGFKAMGSGAGLAELAQFTLRTVDYQPPLAPLKKLDAIMATAIEYDKLCAEPLRIWRVTPNGVEVVSRAGA